MVRSALTKRNPKLIGTNEMENLVVQSLKDSALWVACENSGLDQYSFYHPSYPYILEEKKDKKEEDKDPD